MSDSLTIACKCHGVSGSCSIKTCWRSLPDFSAIGARLKHHYTSAVEVKRRRRKNRKTFVPLNPRSSATLKKDTLIYYTKSPDYCSADRKTGSIGTVGRYVTIKFYYSSARDSPRCKSSTLADILTTFQKHFHKASLICTQRLIYSYFKYMFWGIFTFLKDDISRVQLQKYIINMHFDLHSFMVKTLDVFNFTDMH